MISILLLLKNLYRRAARDTILGLGLTQLIKVLELDLPPIKD